MRRVRYRKSCVGWIWKFLVVFFIVGLGLGWFGWNYYEGGINGVLDECDGKIVSVVFKQGGNVSDLASELKKKGVIFDDFLFRVYGRVSGLDTKILPGRYELSCLESIVEIYNDLMNPEKSQVVVLIPEGSSILEIEERLLKLGLVESGEFVNAVKEFDGYDKFWFLTKEKHKKLIYPLEGFLFPDTYYVNRRDFKVENMIDLMLKNFERRISFVDKIEISKLFDVMNVAAMVEEEANKDVDRPIIAGIIWKRLEAGWALGIDATSLYLKNSREITYKDLQEDSPYNTRKFLGLPPGPITNPGLASIKAAFEPEESPYWFYITGKDGKMYYARSLAEHNENIRKYLR